MNKKAAVIVGYYTNGKSKRSLARELGLNFRTVKKYIDEHEVLQQSGTNILSAPQYREITSRPKKRLTVEVVEDIADCLNRNKENRQKGRSKQLMNKHDIYEYLQQKGHLIGYTTVCNYVRKQEQSNHQKIYLKQSYQAGENIEFDWGEVRLELGGQERRLQMAVFTNKYSNYRWAYLFYRQDMQSFLESHNLFLYHIGGVPKEIVYDNMRVAVKKYSYNPKEKIATDELLKLSAYYQFQYRFCNAYSGNEKGNVERSVEYIRRKSFSLSTKFDDLEKANLHLEQQLILLNNKPPKAQKEVAEVLLKEELNYMRSVPVTAYQTAILKKLAINKYHCVYLDSNHYSIPEKLKRKYVTLKIETSRFHVLDDKEQIIVTKMRHHTKNQWYIDIYDYLNTFSKKPGALAHSSALQQVQTGFKTLYHQFFKGNEKEYIQVLQWMRTEKISIKELEEKIEFYQQKAPQSKIDYALLQMLYSAETPSAVTSKEDEIEQYSERLLLAHSQMNTSSLQN
ncbi:IS21 family transposase [Flammeovirga pectinis]|uniref:IS21 family transposase n=1 Tax=Flammeovirga pectinis TaxID=2494373 RepID=A0A3Q9FU96_9BACT|nr:IS21 family transposase [Flammeovirga pectinis]AZQ64723.1 IS21 family transposase [Flammeovirga pectinis]AZQ65379.1 IS21 family transposase [Flammeovirga pectinis]